MKKFFLFAAAAIAAMTVNAKVVAFNGIVDKTSAETAVSSFETAFNLTNITIAGKANSSGDAYYAEVSQKDASTDWETTTMKLKSDAQAYFAFKDGNANKVVMKYWADYAQPNGKAVALIITGLKVGDIVTINLKEALNKEVAIEGATASSDNFATTAINLIAMGSEIRIYSKNVAGDADAKWKLQSVEVPDAGDQGIEDVDADVKAIKTYENGQLVIIKNGVKYNALGTVIE